MNPAWGWPVAFAIFAAGLGAGAYLVSAAALYLWKGRWEKVARVGVYLSGPAIALAALVFILDLGRPDRALNVYSNPLSVMSVGAWLLTATSVLAIIHGALLWTGRTARRLYALGSPLAFGTAMYTGFLMGILLPKGLWYTPALPWLFLASSLSTGLAAVGLLGLEDGVMKRLEGDHALLLVLELALVALYLATTGFPGALITGPLAFLFLGGVLVLGILVPLLYSLYALRTEALNRAALTGTFALVLLGGFLLRYSILMGGQL